MVVFAGAADDGDVVIGIFRVAGVAHIHVVLQHGIALQHRFAVGQRAAAAELVGGQEVQRVDVDVQPLGQIDVPAVLIVAVRIFVLIRDGEDGIVGYVLGTVGAERIVQRDAGIREGEHIAIREIDRAGRALAGKQQLGVALGGVARVVVDPLAVKVIFDAVHVRRRGDAVGLVGIQLVPDELGVFIGHFRFLTFFGRRVGRLRLAAFLPVGGRTGEQRAQGEQQRQQQAGHSF